MNERHTVLLLLLLLVLFVGGSGAEQREDDSRLRVETDRSHQHPTAALHHLSTCPSHTKNKPQLKTVTGGKCPDISWLSRASLHLPALRLQSLPPVSRHIGLPATTLTNLIHHYNNIRLTALCPDYPGKPVPER